METKIPLMPLYASSEYMLVLSPEEHLQERIAKIRLVVEEKASARIPARKSHILLAKWNAWDMQEEKILQRLHVLSMEQYPFKVHLEGFAGFPSHTLYIPVTSREPILRLVTRLKQHKRLMQSGSGNPYFISDPHLPIARGLTGTQYEQAMQFLGSRNFRGNFIASAMLLLKRRAGGSAFQVLKRFEFEHMPVTARQANLFA